MTTLGKIFLFLLESIHCDFSIAPSWQGNSNEKSYCNDSSAELSYQESSNEKSKCGFMEN